MNKVKPARLLLPLALLLALAQAAAAQTNARQALASLPDSQAVLYVNAHRVVHDVMPRVMPPADYAKMLKEAQQFGFDVRGLDYLAVGARLAEPAPANNLPEFVVVLHGNFNADTLLALGRVAAGSQNISPRRETYGSKTLEIIDLQSIGKKPDGADGQGEPKSSPMPYPEVAVMALDANTLVAGVPAYVRALVDAAEGRGALKSSMVDLAARDPQALWSLTVEPPPALIDYLHKFGAPSNKEFDEMIDWVKQVSLAQGLDALNYTMSASLLTDSPEHASAFSGLVRMGLLAAQTGLSSEAAKLKPSDKSYAQARAALDAIKTFVNRTEGNTLLLSFSVPQKVVHDLVRNEMGPKRAAQTTAPRRRGRARRR
ncbi:MAG: hypothetical protein JOZ96_07720 [Acidobacteria bacterium]|nr:hypothetical protein [Acidobacteriota bacterium]